MSAYGWAAGVVVAVVVGVAGARLGWPLLMTLLVGVPAALAAMLAVTMLAGER
jgi:hypothetical protein